MKIYGLSHPLPTHYAKRIYNDKKNVFVCKSYLGKVSKGDKFILYESQGAKAYTGWADIKSINKINTRQIIRKFKDKLIIDSNELKEYAGNRNQMTVIEFENFEKFKSPIKPNRFVIVSGKYIYEDEFKKIKSQLK